MEYFEFCSNDWIFIKCSEREYNLVPLKETSLSGAKSTPMTPGMKLVREKPLTRPCICVPQSTSAIMFSLIPQNHEGQERTGERREKLILKKIESNSGSVEKNGNYVEISRKNFEILKSSISLLIHSDKNVVLPLYVAFVKIELIDTKSTWISMLQVEKIALEKKLKKKLERTKKELKKHERSGKANEPVNKLKLLKQRVLKGRLYR